MGMLHVATAVSFLNNDCKMVRLPACPPVQSTPAAPLRPLAAAALAAGCRACPAPALTGSPPAAAAQIHGNVCLAAVVVTESLDWKLSGFDLLSEHALPGDFSLSNSSWMVRSSSFCCGCWLCCWLCCSCWLCCCCCWLCCCCCSWCVCSRPVVLPAACVVAPLSLGQH
jgi:hypothetical protein